MKRFKKYQGTEAFIGMPGSGKTYALVEKARAAIAEGKHVYTNAGFKVKGCESYRTLEEMLIIPNGSVILLDEAQAMFNARRWQEFPDGLLYRLSQIRKDGLEFYWSSQHEDFVDVTLRRLTFWFWHCRALSGRVLRRVRWAPEEFRRERERPRERRFVFVRDAVTDLYDTTAKVAISLPMLRRIRDASREPLIELEPGMSMAEVLKLADTLLARDSAFQGRSRGRSRSRSSWPEDGADFELGAGDPAQAGSAPSAELLPFDR